ncbi:LexA/Signal peptidase [Stereum hirsutum FP-91666 SS1]|uniref:LexA/Signal peptidase n=1 Tax=Stereum hirsutum (strain FP-91666) TaxID=721885 RepID=UPI000444A4CE|nr:LexA/Signal peptidase [Stereum hirsutum FP-91666 SS1]EIM83356.1 LexA/Signal peptidase [Stereum hirsutum FP-91666 SS1]
MNRLFTNGLFRNVRSWPNRATPVDVGMSFLYGVNFFCAYHLFVEYVGSIQQVYGPSMLPTMSTHGEAILENRLSFYRHGAASLHRGSMITFHSPLSPSRVVCKRIIGLPGDIVCVDPTGLKAPSTEHAVVPKGHIWVAGDNATWSTDSRDYGPVPMGLVRGHMFARIYPFSKATIFPNTMTYIDE